MNNITTFIFIINNYTMAWKVKKDWIGKQPSNVNYPLEELTQKQINKLSNSLRNAYFEQEVSKPKKKVKTKEVKIEDDLDFIGGNNGN